MTPCRLCTEVTVPDTHTEFGICAKCSNTLGVLPLPPARRPPRPCMRCNAMKFVRAIPREYTAERMYHGARERAAPMSVTTAPAIRPNDYVAGNTVEIPDILYQRYGSLEMYICLGCGFIEWYCHDAERIPLGPEYMTELVDYDAPGPYR